MKHALLTLAVAAACAWTSSASAAMTRDEYKAQKESIELSYKADHAKCDGLSGNAKDICVTQAKGTRKVALAELEGQYKPSTKANYKTRLARAEAAYETAKERCDDMAGNAKDVCREDAKAAYTSAKADAKAVRSTDDALKDAAADKRDAEYGAARTRCDNLAGDAKESCLNDAKLKFGKS
jgi:hypothetical protein